jgi:hypothetical protein
LSSLGGGEIIPYWKTKQFFEKKKNWRKQKYFLYLNAQNNCPRPLCVKSRDLKFELWGFLTQEKKHKKDTGRFTIVFVARLFTF